MFSPSILLLFPVFAPVLGPSLTMIWDFVTRDMGMDHIAVEHGIFANKNHPFGAPPFMETYKSQPLVN